MKPDALPATPNGLSAELSLHSGMRHDAPGILVRLPRHMQLCCRFRHGWQRQRHFGLPGCILVCLPQRLLWLPHQKECVLDVLAYSGMRHTAPGVLVRLPRQLQLCCQLLG